MRFLSLLAVFAFSGATQAALPPGAYDKLRIAAEEAITIEVSGVKVVHAGNQDDVTVDAKVIGLERTKNGLHRGDAIIIKYAIATPPIPGPVPVPVIEKNIVYPAFLNKKGTDFEPAAYGWSFKMTPEM